MPDVAPEIIYDPSSLSRKPRLGRSDEGKSSHMVFLIFFGDISQLMTLKLFAFGHGASNGTYH